MSSIREIARQAVREHFAPVKPGRYAVPIKLLSMTNAVVGISIRRSLAGGVLASVIPDVTIKNFTGSISRIGIHKRGKSQATLTALWFGPGSVEMIGVRNPDTARLAAQIIRHKFLAAGYPEASLGYISVDNIVCKGRLPHPIKLENLIGNVPGYVDTYDPESLPGMVLAAKGRGTFMLFHSGGISALGVSSIDEMQDEYVALAKVCLELARDLPTGQKQTQQSVDRAAQKQNVITTQSEKQRAGNYKKSVRIMALVRDFNERNAAIRDSPEYKVLMDKMLAEEMLPKNKRPKKGTGKGSRGPRKKQAVEEEDEVPYENNITMMEIF